MENHPTPEEKSKLLKKYRKEWTDLFDSPLRHRNRTVDVNREEIRKVHQILNTSFMIKSTEWKRNLCAKCRAFPLSPLNNNDTTLMAPKDETRISFAKENDNYKKVMAYVLKELQTTACELEEMRKIVKKLS